MMRATWLQLRALAVLWLLPLITTPHHALSQNASLPALHDRPANARQYLSLFGIDESQLEQFRDGEPLGTAEEPLLGKILYRLSKASNTDLHRWSAQTTDWREMADAIDSHRGDAVVVDGRAIAVETRDIAPEIAVRLDLQQYSIVRVALSDSLPTVLLCAPSIPSAWKKQSEIDEPIRAVGVVLKTGKGGPESTELLLAANHIRWFPIRESPELGVAREHVLLARHGMDIATLDDLQGRDGRALETKDSDCFYGMLGAVGQIPPHEMSATRGRADLRQLLRQPQAERLHLLSLEASAKRVTKILVDDAERQQQLNADHYFQIDAFVPLTDLQIALGSKEQAADESSQKRIPTYTNSYPVTLCARRLPAGMSEGDGLNIAIEADAFFFRLWSYRSTFVSEFDPDLRQVSPMFLTHEPRLRTIEAVSNPMVGWILLGTLAIAVVSVTIGLFRRQRPTKRALPDRID